jgi:hypothetical protein
MTRMRARARRDSLYDVTPSRLNGSLMMTLQAVSGVAEGVEATESRQGERGDDPKIVGQTSTRVGCGLSSNKPVIPLFYCHTSVFASETLPSKATSTPMALGQAGDVLEMTVLKKQPRSDEALNILKKVHSVSRALCGWMVCSRLLRIGGESRVERRRAEKGAEAFVLLEVVEHSASASAVWGWQAVIQVEAPSAFSRVLCPAISGSPSPPSPNLVILASTTTSLATL